MAAAKVVIRIGRNIASRLVVQVGRSSTQTSWLDPVLFPLQQSYEALAKRRASTKQSAFAFVK